MEQFTIRDFGGGLNTAMDEANLPANMSASLLNIDFMDSRALSRRNGYTRITATPLEADPVDALYRYYKKNDTKYWVSVAGTALYTQQYVTTTVPLTRLEAEAATITATPQVTYSLRNMSGGKAVGCTATMEIPVPHSTSVTLGWTSNVTASLKLDAGSWVTATAGTKTWAGLTATAHTVYLKPKAKNTKSAKLLTSGAATDSYVRAYRATPAGTKHVRFRFYDQGFTDRGISRCGVSVHDNPATAGYALNWSSTDAVYSFSVYRGDLYYAWPETRIITGAAARTTGWHTVDFIADGAYMRCWLDNVFVGMEATTMLPAYANFAAYEPGTGGSAVALWVDTVETSTSSTSYTNVLTVLDDFDNISGWTSAGLDAAFTNDTVIYDTTKYSVYADYIDYSAIGTHTKALTTLTATTDTFAFATHDDNCYFSSAYDQLSKYDGSSVTAITATNTPACAFLVVKGQRMFGAGNATDPSKLYYTELDDPEDWGKSGTQNGIYLAGQDAGGTSTGLAVANGLLYYFSQSRTYALDTTGTPDTWDAKCLSDSHGCIAPKSIAVAPNAVIFLSGDGVRAHGTVQNVYSDDGSAFVTLSDNIKPTLMAYTDAQKKAAVGAVYQNRYWLAIGSDVYVCDLEKRTENNQPPWTKYDGHDINCMAVTRADEYGLYAGSKTSGHLYKLDTGGNDNGSDIGMFYKTPPLAPKGYTTVKHFKHLHLAAEAPQDQSLDVTFTTDDVSAPVQTVTFDAGNDIQPKRLLVSSRGRSAQVTLESSGTDQDITISELTVMYNPKPKAR